MLTTANPVYKALDRAEIAAERGDVFVEQLWRREAERLAFLEAQLGKGA